MSLAIDAKVELGFGSTWQTEPGDIEWTDVTCFVNDRRGELSVQRGATSAFGVAGTGTANLELNNADRRFDPLHAAGPHFGDLVPGVPVRITAVGGGLSYLFDGGDQLFDGGDPLYEVDDDAETPIFTGFVSGWPQASDGPTFSTVRIEAFDGFDMLANAPLEASPYDDVVFASSTLNWYWKLDDAPESQTAVDSGGSDFHGTYYSDPTVVDSPVAGSDRARRFDGTQVASTLAATTDQNAYGMQAVVEAWVRVDELTGSDQYAVAWGFGGAQQGVLRLGVTGTGEAFFEAGSSVLTGPLSRRIVMDSINDGQWHHVNGYVMFRSPVLDPPRAGLDGVAYLSDEAFTGPPPKVGIGVGGSINPMSTGGRWHGSVSHAAGYLTGYADPMDHPGSATRIAAANPWDGDRPGERVDRLLDAVDWPDDARDLDDGLSILGPTPPLEGEPALGYLQAVEQAEDGRLFIGADGSMVFRERTFSGTSVLTLTDDETDDENVYADLAWTLDADLVTNSASYARRNGATIVREDAASITAYGKRSESITDLLLRTENEVAARADWTLLTRADPQVRVLAIEIPVHNHRHDAAAQAALVGLELGDVITLRRTPQGVGSEIERAFRVAGVRHRMAFAEWRMELYVEPDPWVDGSLTPFTWNVSEWDDVDVWTY